MTALTRALLPLLILLPLTTWARDAAPLPPPTASPPETTTSGDAPGVTPDEAKAITEVESADVRAYTRKDGTTVTEYARHGRVYMIKVQPPGGLPPYYLYDEHGDGQFSRRLPGSYKHLAPPQWVIQEF